MMFPPSRRLHKAMNEVAGDSSYFEQLDKRKAYLDEASRCMDGSFGITLLASLESMESEAYSTLYKSNMKSRVAQAKAEIKTIQFIKGRLMSLRIEKANVDGSIEELMENKDDG